MNSNEVARARYNHLSFMKALWQNTNEPMLVGIHTKAICHLIDMAMDDYRHGKSTFLVVKVPFRHGKSEIISRYLPSHFLGEFPEDNVMLVTYASSLAEGFSRYARSLFKDNKFKEIYPDIELSKSNGGVQSWGIEGHLGTCTASGLGSGLTGRGYSLGCLDDFCSSRADAESEVMRNSMWEHFTNDFLTRRAPVSITIVLATPWHVDDIIGRIEQKIDKDSKFYDPDFPPFKIISFPAKDGEVDVEDIDKSCIPYKTVNKHIKYDYLFTKAFDSDGKEIKGRFEETWYKQQFASLGSYASASLLQCSPTTRGGNLIDVSKIKMHSDVTEFPIIKYYRVWDLAHSAKQRIKADPDWTSGTLLGFRNVNGVLEMWIKDVARIRAEAPERDRFINMVSEKDGQGVTVGVEISLDARDAVKVMQDATKGRRIIKPIQTKGDKVSRMSYLEPVFEAGNVHILRGEWNLDWFNEVKEFPSGKHDDQVDNMSACYALLYQQKNTMERIRVNGV